MIDSTVVAQIIGSLMLSFVLGYGIGQSVAWVKKLRDVA